MHDTVFNTVMFTKCQADLVPSEVTHGSPFTLTATAPNSGRTRS